MTSRDQILARVREALSVKAPPPGAHGNHQATPSPPAATAGLTARKWLPAVGPTEEERWTGFLKNATDLKAVVHLVDNLADAGQKLAALMQEEGWKRAATHQGPLAHALAAGLGLPLKVADDKIPASELETCDAGITECDALVAQTGSVLVTARSAGGRALSVLPPHHVVIARRDQLVSDLPAAFDLLKKKYADAYPSFISFITGPSRTGDIERILVLGAHGPKRLTIFCLKNSG